MRGFTAVRDVGGPVFGLKRTIDEGVIAGPCIYPSSRLRTDRHDSWHNQSGYAALTETPIAFGPMATGSPAWAMSSSAHRLILAPVGRLDLRARRRFSRFRRNGGGHRRGRLRLIGCFRCGDGCHGTSTRQARQGSRAPRRNFLEPYGCLRVDSESWQSAVTTIGQDRAGPSCFTQPCRLLLANQMRSARV